MEIHHAVSWDGMHLHPDENGLTGGVRSFLTFMPLVLPGGSLACSFLGQPIFLFKGVILEADTPLAYPEIRPSLVYLG